MTEPQRKALVTSAINVARIAFASAIIGGCAVGLAAQADADSGDCNPFYLSMTPTNPVLGCSGPDAAPPADGSPVLGPVDGVASPTDAGCAASPRANRHPRRPVVANKLGRPVIWSPWVSRELATGPGGSELTLAAPRSVFVRPPTAAAPIVGGASAGSARIHVLKSFREQQDSVT